MDIESLTALYRCFVESGQPLDPGVQVGMVRNLVAAEEFSLLAEFATRPDVSPEADALVKECNNPQVIAGWASRPGVDTAEVLERLSGEKRVAALLPLASRSNLPPEIYGMLLGRGSSKLTKALLENADTPLEAKKKFLPEFIAALEHPDRRGHRYQRVGELRRFVCEDVDVILGVLALANDPVMLTCALEILEEKFPGRRTEGIRLVVPRVKSVVSLRIESDLTTMASCDASGLHELLEVLGAADLDPAQLKDVRAALAVVTARFKKLKCEYMLKDAKNRLSKSGRETLVEVMELASTADSGRAKALIKKLITAPRADDGPHYEKAVKAAVGNLGLPVELLLSLNEDLDDEDRLVLVTRWLKDGRTEAAAKLLVDEYLADSYLENIEDAALVRSLIEATVRVVVEQGADVPSWALRHKALIDDPELAISLLPWKSISEVADPDPFGDSDDVDAVPVYEPVSDRDVVSSTERVYQAAQQIIAERLGGDLHKWETFAALAEEFDGTLPDLLNAAASL